MSLVGGCSLTHNRLVESKWTPEEDVLLGWCISEFRGGVLLTWNQDTWEGNTSRLVLVAQKNFKLVSAAASRRKCTFCFEEVLLGWQSKEQRADRKPTEQSKFIFLPCHSSLCQVTPVGIAYHGVSWKSRNDFAKSYPLHHRAEGRRGENW